MKKGKLGRNNNHHHNNNSNSNSYNHENSSNNSNGFLPNSLRIIGSCLKAVSANATSVASTVKSAAASISAVSDDHREQVTWAGFDKLELSSSVWRHVLLLGYQNGFQVVDVDDALKFSELVSKRDDGPATFLQMQPIPLRSNDQEGFQKSHPLLLVVGCRDESKSFSQVRSRSKNCLESDAEDSASCVRFYSLRSHSYVHVLKFMSYVCMVRCSPRIVAVGLAKQICCFDALTLENKVSVLTYPVPQVVGHGKGGVNVGYGPLALGPRWLAYASNDPLWVKTGLLSPQTLSPSPGTYVSTSPSNGGIVAHYAVESGKHLASGIVTLGDKGYKTLSKYCHELLPDGSNSGSRTARSTSAETDNAGVVAVMDFISNTVSFQFKAHSTPISALCFDPSGTLLVTASVHGNSINVFRIIPCRNISGSVSQSYNSSSSSVHLYKFHRGIRSAIIQDICFSRYSQWIAVVSSKGTCHVFVLSPFGGNVDFQNDNDEEASVTPVLTMPWWSASTCTINQQSFQPPPPVTLSVVSRIKVNKSSMLNKVPAGALAAVFHNSLSRDSLQVQKNGRSLEHLLVYTPSGHVVQHEIQPSFRVENDDNSRAHSTSSMLSQDPELKITINPVQWWDVCRRSNWSEQQDCISEIKSTVMHSSRSCERLHWYLSNAEVQYSSMRLPVWQKLKISFRAISSSSRIEDYANREYEIEKFPVSEVEIRHKDLLPVFDHFHSMKPALLDRGGPVTRHANFSNLDPRHAKDKNNEETVICHSKPASFSSTESSDGGSSRRIDHLLDLDHLNADHAYMPYYQNANEHYQGKNVNVIEDHSFLENMLRSENIMPPEFSSKNLAIAINTVEANVLASISQSVTVGVISHKEASELHSHKGNVSDISGNEIISFDFRDFVDSGTPMENAFSEKLEPVAGLEEADSRMELTKQNLNLKDGFLCSLLSLNEKDGENTNKAQGQDTLTSINTSYREGNPREEDERNNSGSICDITQGTVGDMSASPHKADLTMESTEKQNGTKYSSLLRKDEVEDDMLGDIFPFSEEG